MNKKLTRKIVEITSCLQCPHYNSLGYVVHDENECGLKNLHVKNDCFIPDWCPLPDAEDEVTE